MTQAMDTGRLLIRRFTEDDAQAFQALASLPEVIRYTGDEPVASLAAARQLLADKPLRDYALHGFGRMACVEKSSGRVVGFSGLKYLEDLGEVDIGYRFLPDCWGKGYATESARAVMAVELPQWKIDRVIGRAHPDNAGSLRVLEKLGLRFEREVGPEEGGMPMRVYATPGTGPAQAYRPRTL